MSPIRLNSITTTTVLKYVFGAIALGLLAAYVIFQARVFIAGPQISLHDEPPVISESRVVTLSGRATNITEISLNGRTIHTDEAGNFEEDVVLEDGYSVVELRAHDRYDRTKVLTRKFVYKPRTVSVN